jgi:hypothetical protein
MTLTRLDISDGVADGEASGPPGVADLRDSGVLQGLTDCKASRSSDLSLVSALSIFCTLLGHCCA